MVSEITTKYGLIGFFDILGYSNFLQNNSAGDAAQVVVNVLQSLPTEVRSIVCEELGVKQTLSTYLCAGRAF